MAVRDIATATRIIRITDTHRMLGAIEAITRILTTITPGRNITTTAAITKTSFMVQVEERAAVAMRLNHTVVVAATKVGDMKAEDTVDMAVATAEPLH